MVQPERYCAGTKLSDTDRWGPIDPETALRCFRYDGESLEDVRERLQKHPVPAKQTSGGTLIVVSIPADARRLEAAKAAGATLTLGADGEDVAATIKSLGDGYDVDVVLDAAGISATLSLALDVVQPGCQRVAPPGAGAVIIISDRVRRADRPRAPQVAVEVVRAVGRVAAPVVLPIGFH